MIGMMLVIIIILMTKVMPVFDQVFRQFGQEMTGFSRGILLAGNALSRYSAVFAVLLAVIVCAGIYFTKTESGRKKLYHIGSGFAFSRELKDKLSACRFAGGMSLALKSGLTPEQGMEFSENLIEDDDFRKKVAECKADMENGTDIAEALVKAGIFTGVYARMTSIAGKAGMMDEMMGRIADECEEEVDEKLSSMIAVLEPTLVIILSVIVDPSVGYASASWNYVRTLGGVCYVEKRTGTVLSRKTAAPTSEFLSVPSAVCMYLQCFFQWI